MEPKKAESSWARCRAELATAASERSPADWILKILGWVITAFAGSLGASYWFAAISKVINIRSSGPRPVIEKEKAQQGA